MLNIEGKTYAFNLKKIVEFINYSDKAESKESEITDSYEVPDGAKDLKLSGKLVRQLTTPGNQGIDNIKYDLLKMFISEVLMFGVGEDEEANDEIPFGMSVAINTMIKEGFLIEIKD